MSALQIVANSFFVMPNTPVPFGASGGTPPYAFNIFQGGAGGSINPSTGLYQAPPNFGIDNVQVTDSLGATSTVKIQIDSAIQLVCDVIQNQLNLQQGQVYLYNQKINIPTDSRLYVAVGIISCKPFSNTNKYDGSGSNSNAVQSTNFQALLSIDILSRGLDALNRKEEIIMALMSNYAESQQEINGFYIGKISSGFVNLSDIDGAAIPYRFNISVNIQYQITKTVGVAYFDTFTMPPSVTEDE